MHWLMICRHKPDAHELKDRHQTAHREHVASGGNGLVKVLIGSALNSDANLSEGNFGILEAASREAVTAFAEQDPFARAGLVESIEVIKLPSRFQAYRIIPMTS